MSLYRALFLETQCLRSAAPTRVLGDRLQQGNQSVVVVPQAIASARSRWTRRRPTLAPIARRPAAAAPRLWVRRCLPLCPKHSRSLPSCANVRQAGNNAVAADRGPIHLRQSLFHTHLLHPFLPGEGKKFILKKKSTAINGENRSGSYYHY